MTYCDGENDDREVDPDGDNNTNCQELDQDYGTVRLWHSKIMAHWHLHSKMTCYDEGAVSEFFTTLLCISHIVILHCRRACCDDLKTSTSRHQGI